MSLDKIEKYISELEAIKNYERVLRERNELSTEAAQQKKMLEDRGHELEQANKAAEERREKTERLESTLKECQERASDAETRVAELTNRVSELELAKVSAEGMTLPEIEKEMRARKEDEITGKADEFFNTLKTQWESTEKPQAVAAGSLELLKTIISQLRGSEPDSFPKELADTGLPAQVREILEKETGRRMDREFHERVKREAKTELERLKTTEWPRFLAENVTPKADALSAQFRSDMIGVIRKQAWRIECDKCQTVQVVMLSPEMLDALVRFGSSNVGCSNDSCKDFFGIRHATKLTLRGLMGSLIIPDQNP